MLPKTWNSDRLVATAATPAYAAHFVQVGDKRSAMLRVGYTSSGKLFLEPFTHEVPYTIFISGTIVLSHEACPPAEAKDVSFADLQELLDCYEGWDLLLP